MLLSPESIDISSLPSLPLSDRALLPEIACIYFAIDAQEQIQYIGCSSNLATRWIGHHRYHQLEKIEGVRIAYLTLAEPNLLQEVEKALIEWFEPHLNNTKVEKRPPVRPSNDIDFSAIARPPSITLKEFVKKWGITRDQLSQLTDVPLGTMAHWFSENNDLVEPESFRRGLSYLDYLLSMRLEADRLFPELETVFNSLRDNPKGEVFKNTKYGKSN